MPTELRAKLGEASQLFDRLFTHRIDVGLLSEEYDAKIERMVGNFSQAPSRLALIHAAFTISGQWTRGPYTQD